MRTKVALVVPHGVAARNFLLTGFLGELAQRADVLVIHTLGERLPSLVPACSGPGHVEWLDCPPFRDGPLSLVMRKCFQVAHLRVCGTTAMGHILNEWRPGSRWVGNSLLERIVWNLSRVIRSQKQLRRWTRVYAALKASGQTSRSFGDIFREHHPSVVLCCDQRFPVMAAAVGAGRRLGIPVGAFIFSWDNLSSKGRMPCEFDFYCVWSELMKEELTRFYPFIDGDAVHVTGTPQFEPYRDDELRMSREDFCDWVRLDHSRPIILFSGEDARTDPENPAHLQALCDLVRKGEIVGRPQIILRPAPSDGEERWREVRRRNADLALWSPPAWVRSSGDGALLGIPTTEDVRLLTNTIHHSACGVNMVSTVTLDLAIGGKPAVNIAFDVSDNPPHGFPIWKKHFRFEHYRPVVELGAALTARSKEGLATAVNQALSNPDSNRQGREKLIQLQTDGTIGSASRNICNALMERASGVPSGRPAR